MPHRASYIFSAVFALAFLAFACDRAPNQPDAAGAAGAATQPSRQLPLLVATTPMVGDVVSAVAGAHAKVVVLIGPGVDPHLWTPTRTDVLEILDADAVFLNGLMLEGRVGDSFARVETAGRPVLRLAQSIDRKELLTDPKRASYFDPHVWMDPTLWAMTAAPIAELLAKLDPQHADEFHANADRYEARAHALADECAQLISSIPSEHRTLVSAHDAFAYFGKRFGLEVYGIQGLSTESEASIADIENLVAHISSKHVPTAFVETTVSDRTIRALVEGCASIGHELKIGEPLYSDSMGRASTPEGSWEGMIRHNARVIAASLGGDNVGGHNVGGQNFGSQPSGGKR